MIRRPLLAAALALVLATPAHAGDARIAHHRYVTDEVVRIPGRAGIQSTIAFGDDERIENVAIGDAASWQVTPNKRANMLFLKPLAPRARTNMTVVTDRYAYCFDLVAAPGAAPLYVLRFTYPDEPKRAQGGTQPTLTDEEARALAEKPAEAQLDPARLNFAWKAKGKASVLPARVYDDGQSTYLTWAPQSPIPAIQLRNEVGTEGPANFAVRGDVIVIEGVPRVIVLRSGRDLGMLERTAPPAAPAAPSPAVAAVTGATPAPTKEP